jgi:tetratricopeptide (TPR) repeat protein
LFNGWDIPWLHFKNVGHNEYWAFESDPDYSRIKLTHDTAQTLVQRPDNKIPILEFLTAAYHALPKAVDDFWNMRGDVIRPGAEAEFTRQAAAWRMLSVKPALPEVVKTQRMLAEAFLQDKDLATATQHYRLGLKAYPMWPQGWFNLALINGELGNYKEASCDMRFYLELVPDAEDAEAAKMKMLVWAEKAGKK